MGLAEVSFRPPTLRGARVLLRGWEPSDVDAVFAYASDPEVTPYMAWDRHQTRDDSRFYLEELVAANYARGDLDYAVCLASDPSRPLGGMGLFVRSVQHETMELGYVLGRAHWGAGLVPEAGRLLIDHAFRTTRVERIWAPIFAENAKSRRAALKMGMQLEGVLRSALCFRGQRHDEAVHAIVRADWLAAQSP